jgi:GT2 family glycosyltransferase
MAGRFRQFVVPGEEAVLVNVTIVVPVWNQPVLLQRLLESISRQTRQPDEVIIVDSGSIDDAADVARRWGARVISLGRNVGFAAAVNRGIAECSSAYVALINSDVELQANWMEVMLRAAEENGAWFCCGKLLMSADRSRLDGTWDLIATSGFPLRAGHGHVDSAVYGVARSIALASATATLYRRDLFTNVGRFDETFESYLEDVDFSLRCAVGGFSGRYEPGAVAYHLGGGSQGRMVHLFARNQVLLVRKLFPAELQRKFRSRILLGRLLWGALAARRGRFTAWASGIAEARRTKVEHAPLELGNLEQLLRDCEHEIRSAARGDLYWHLYFLFTGSESR